MSVVAWDFDGVLDRSVAGGRFLWAERFEEDTGQSLAVFQDHVLARGFEAVLTGREDLRHRAAGWAEAVGYAPGPDALLGYWFARDLRLDPGILALVDDLAQRGVPQILATNDEPRRVAYIEREAGLGALAGRVFASSGSAPPSRTPPSSRPSPTRSGRRRARCSSWTTTTPTSRRPAGSAGARSISPTRPAAGSRRPFPSDVRGPCTRKALDVRGP